MRFKKASQSDALTRFDLGFKRIQGTLSRCTLRNGIPVVRAMSTGDSSFSIMFSLASMAKR